MGRSNPHNLQLSTSSLRVTNDEMLRMLTMKTYMLFLFCFHLALGSPVLDVTGFAQSSHLAVHTPLAPAIARRSGFAVDSSLTARLASGNPDAGISGITARQTAAAAASSGAAVQAFRGKLTCQTGHSSKNLVSDCLLSTAIEAFCSPSWSLQSTVNASPLHINTSFGPLPWIAMGSASYTFTNGTAQSAIYLELANIDQCEQQLQLSGLALWPTWGQISPDQPDIHCQNILSSIAGHCRSWFDGA